jgi:hypothetical protein
MRLGLPLRRTTRQRRQRRRATVLATAALALNQVDRVIRAVRGGENAGISAEPPPTLDTTLEFDVNTGAIVARRWSRHPRCWC